MTTVEYTSDEGVTSESYLIVTDPAGYVGLSMMVTPGDFNKVTVGDRIQYESAVGAGRITRVIRPASAPN